MITRVILTVLLAGVSISALAAEPRAGKTSLQALPPITKKSEISSQIRVVRYSATKRQEITGVVGQPTTFKFPSGESVYRVVQTTKVGSDGNLTEAGWQGPKPEEVKDTPLGNVVTLWPARPGYSTMTIITKLPDGSQKPYAYRLTAITDTDGAADRSDVTLNLISEGGPTGVNNPGRAGGSSDDSLRKVASSTDDQPRPRPVSQRARKGRAEDEAAAERIRIDAFNRAEGCQFTVKGTDSTIEPRCPLTNNIWTLLRFPGLTQKPSVYISDPAYLCGADDGSHERLARQHQAGDLVVVEEIAQRLCVRLSPYVLQIDNTAWNPAGAPTGNGTIAPSTRRDLIKASK